MKGTFSLVSSILLCAVSFVSPGASADMHPYIGADAQMRHMTFKNGFGRGLFKKNVPQGNGYVGARFGDYFAVEGGYEATPERTKTVFLSSGDSDLNFPLPAGNPVEGHIFKEKLQGWHINLLGLMPCVLNNQSMQFFAGIGLSQKKLRVVDSHISDDGVLFTPQNIVQNEVKFVSKKTLMRLSLGVRTMLIKDCVGIRGIVNWENTAKFRNLRPQDRPANILRVSLRDTMSYGLGVFAEF